MPLLQGNKDCNVLNELGKINCTVVYTKKIPKWLVQLFHCKTFEMIHPNCSYFHLSFASQEGYLSFWGAGLAELSPIFLIIL